MKKHNQMGEDLSSNSIRNLVASGEISEWLIDRWVAKGHDDPRKHYRTITLANATYWMVVALILGFAIYMSRNIAYAAQRTVNLWFFQLVFITVMMVLAIFSADHFRRVFVESAEKLTWAFEDMLKRLVLSPRPQFTSANLVSDHELLRSIEDALVDLAARKIVFLEYEQTVGAGMPKLSHAVHEDLGRLLDVGKELGLLRSSETYHRFFQRAEMFRVRPIREDFKKMLAGLKEGEQPPLFW